MTEEVPHMWEYHDTESECTCQIAAHAQHVAQLGIHIYHWELHIPWNQGHFYQFCYFLSCLKTILWTERQLDILIGVRDLRKPMGYTSSTFPTIKNIDDY